MKFKDWLQESVGTAVLNGGIGEAPNDGINIGFPVRSKTSCGDGSPPSEEKTKKSPDSVFGFFREKDKIRSAKRLSPALNNRNGTFVVDLKPSSIGFGTP